MVAGRLLGFSCGPPCDKVIEKSWRVPGVLLVQTNPGHLKVPEKGEIGHRRVGANLFS